MRPVKFVYADMEPIEFDFGIRFAKYTTTAMRKVVHLGGRGYPRLCAALLAMFLILWMADSACGA